MSKLQDLIRELCPDGVEYKKLGEVCDFINGFAFKSSLSHENGDRIIRITNIDGTNVNIDDVKYFWKSEYKNDLQQFMVQKGDILIAMSGATTGKIGYYSYDENSYLNQRVGKFVPIKEKLNARFLYHFLRSQTEYLYVLAGGGAQPNLSSIKLMNTLEIPLPPLPVQEEIVRILDHFAEYAAELQAELQARKEQYEYYKHTIFKSVSIHYKDFLLKEIATFSQGIQVDPNLQYDTMESGRIRFLRIVDFVSDNEPYRYIETPSDKYIKSENELIMIRYGASAAGKVFMCYSGAIANNMFKINLKPEILPKYVMYYLSQNSIYTLLNSSGGKSTMPAINFKLVGSIHIPIPPYSEQQCIVSILDKFEALVNDLQQGLPAEIAAVQEQYEYYRNKLFSFPRKSA